jgi:hypothetical protein
MPSSAQYYQPDLLHQVERGRAFVVGPQPDLINHVRTCERRPRGSVRFSNVKPADMQKRPLASLPVPSTSFTSDPSFAHPGGEAYLRYEFERAGSRLRAGIRFERVRAFRFRSESQCTAWHVDGAYDTLVEVSPSDWTAELIANSHTPWPWEIRHFLIYVDSAGAYEVAAQSWGWLAEESAADSH